MASHHKKNRLAKERSPYLLQHANNPVDWYPWGTEAFEAAKEMDRPIFLSIGYSSCHWCHVMGRECFEDQEMADLLNSNFISIKVDREERPDIDDLYMKICHMMTGSGGWPLTIMMTPEKVPFFAATYVPKCSQEGMTGLIDLVPVVSHTWKESRGNIDEVTNQVMGQLATLGRDRPKDVDGRSDQKAFDLLSSSYEEKFGGFDISPKFPSPHKLMFLLRHWKRTGSPAALEMATHTLNAISKGGIHDHVGRGFHRYSTDRRWVVPHFEKMLYDQAMLAIAFTEAYQATKNEWFKKVACWTLDYVLNDLGAPEGGFYSSEDADSDGKEGEFYTWTYDDVKEALGVEDISIFVDAFDVREDGNYREESNGMYTGRNILHMTNDIDNLALQRYVPVATVSSTMWVGLNRLKKEREKRVRPARDEKVLIDWNGLTIAALAMSGRAFSEKKYLDRCRKAVDFIEEGNGQDGLRHRYKGGEWAISGFLTDHAFYAWGLLELYQATGEDRYLQLAIGHCDEMMEKFRDEAGGFYMAAYDPLLISRSKELYDGAMPSGNSVALFVLSTLHHMTHQERHREMAERCARYFQSEVVERPDAYCFFLMGQARSTGTVTEVCLVDGGDSTTLEAMRELLDRDYHPDMVLRFCRTKEQAGSVGRKIVKGKVGAYVCQNGACLPPVFDAASLEKILKG